MRTVHRSRFADKDYVIDVTKVPRSQIFGEILIQCPKYKVSQKMTEHWSGQNPSLALMGSIRMAIN